MAIFIIRDGDNAMRYISFGSSCRARISTL